jgi:hypothetical protein
MLTSRPHRPCRRQRGRGRPADRADAGQGDRLAGAGRRDSVSGPAAGGDGGHEDGAHHHAPRDGVVQSCCTRWATRWPKAANCCGWPPGLSRGAPVTWPIAASGAASHAARGPGRRRGIVCRWQRGPRPRRSGSGRDVTPKPTWTRRPFGGRHGRGGQPAAAVLRASRTARASGTAGHQPGALAGFAHQQHVALHSADRASMRSTSMP